MLGDTHDNDPELRCQGQRRGAELVATRRGAYPHQEGGAAVRTVFHQWRSKSIEPFNGLFKGVFAWRVKRPVKGIQRSQLLALGAIVLYQLAWLYHHERGLPVGQGIKPLLRAA